MSGFVALYRLNDSMGRSPRGIPPTAHPRSEIPRGLSAIALCAGGFVPIVRIVRAGAWCMSFAQVRQRRTIERFERLERPTDVGFVYKVRATIS